MEMGEKFWLMEWFMKDSLKMINEKARGGVLIKMGVFMKGNTKQILDRVQDDGLGPMAPTGKVPSMLIVWMAKAK